MDCLKVRCFPFIYLKKSFNFNGTKILLCGGKKKIHVQHEKMFKSRKILKVFHLRKRTWFLVCSVHPLKIKVFERDTKNPLPQITSP